MIIRLHHIGHAVKNLDSAIETYAKLYGFFATDIRNDSIQRDARIMMPNRVWLDLIENNNPESRVCKFIKMKGEGLEHLAFETDDINEEASNIKSQGIRIFQDKIIDSKDGFSVYIEPEQAMGYTIEIIQLHSSSRTWDAEKLSNPNLSGLEHIGIAVFNVGEAAKKFEKILRLSPMNIRTDQLNDTIKDIQIGIGNDRMYLHLLETGDPSHLRVTQYVKKRGEGIEHLAIDVLDIRQAVKRVQAAKVPLFEDRIYLDREDGFEAFVYPEHYLGVTMEFIEPFMTSFGYRYQLEDL
jgi:methylmalonyl-CoA/ethylmalonyl-CoA epimerase